MQNAHMFDILDALLGPVARLFLARKIAFADLAERLKGHYVQAALAEESIKATDSRLSVVTGLSRREIARLRAFEVRPPKPNPLTRLVALWQTHADYSNEAGAMVLQRAGPSPSFETLARLVLQDVHPRTLLDTLVVAGTVRIEDEAVHLLQTAYVPATGSPEQLAYLAENVGDHLSAATDNVFADTPKHFERALQVTGLSRTQIETLAKQHHAGQMALLENLQAQAEKMKKQGEGAYRVRIGAFFFSTGKQT